MKAVNPYLNFEGNTEEAFNFYRSVFGGEFLAVTRFRNFGDNAMAVREEDLDKIAHIALPLGGGTLLMGTDVTGSAPNKVKMGNNFYITLDPESETGSTEAVQQTVGGRHGGDAAAKDRLGRVVWYLRGQIRGAVDGELYG